jgi:AcrR family transcriptional regulator
VGRWEPNTRGRLAQIAHELFAEQGFERTTAAEIAARAGVTERTFFRNFADKREVLFYGGEMLEAHVAQVVATGPDVSSADLVRAAVLSMAAAVQTNPERARTRNATITAHPELRERELTKMDGVVAAIARALRDRGTAPGQARLVAEVGVAVFRTAFTRWVGQESGELPDVVEETFAELSAVLGGSALLGEHDER